MTHDDLQSLLGAYALDALDADEAAEVEAHLAECPRCRSELAAHRNAASLLATVGGEAPARVWDRIAAELASEDSTPGEVGLEPPKLVVPPKKQAKVVPLSIRRKVALPVVAGLAAAAAAAAVVLGVSASRLDDRVNNLSHAISAGGLQQAAAAAVLNPQHQSVQLVSGSSNHPTAQVVLLPDGKAYLVGSDLPALDSHRTYQLWGLVNRKVVSLGLLGPKPQLAAFRVEPAVSRLMVTAEPSGGVPQPTTPVLVQGDLSA